MKILVTGASRGIGRALSAELIREGYEVWGIARGQSDLEQVQKELGAGKFRFTAGDVSSEADSDRALKEMTQAGFEPDAAILNAGIFEDDSQPAFRAQKAAEILRTNLNGALIWVDRLLPIMLRRKGQFIAISSITAFRPEPRSAGYSASKAALTMAFRALRLRYMDEGVRFKTVHLGPIATGIVPRFQDAAKNQGLLVGKLEPTAKYIRKALVWNCGTFFYPFFPTFLFRLSLILPDSLFHRLTAGLRR